jgi:hypothetical protein
MDGFQGVLAILGFVSIFLYGIYAVLGTPTEPARTLIELQARWSGGTYGLKVTMLLTWMVLLLALLAPFVFVYAVKSALRRGEAEPNWLRVGEVKARGKHALLFLAFCLLGALTAYVVFVDPDLFTPIGELGTLVLTLGIVSLFVGPLALFDTLLPSRWVSGPIASAKQSVDSKGQPSGGYEIELAGTKFTIDEEHASLLSPGQSVALRVTRVLERVLEIRKAA